jgi:Zn-dependent protease
MINIRQEYQLYMFTTRELGDFVVSAVVLGFLFSFSPGFLPQGSPWLLNFLIATILATFVWGIHIITQKILAKRYECNVIYFMSPHFIAVSIMFTIFITVMGLGQFVVVIGLVGFIDVTTKYSMRLGYKFMGLTLKETGQIALAGWIANISLAIFFKVLQPIHPAFFIYFMTMSLWIALLNMIPFPPLDASKVISWNFAVWSVAIILSVTLIVALPLIGLLESLLLLVAVLFVGFFVLQRLIPIPTGAGYAE